jgi:voltage-gated potassium channel
MNLNKSVHECLNELQLEEIKKSSQNNAQSARHLSALKLFKSKVFFFFLHPIGLKGFIHQLLTLTIIIGSITLGSIVTIKSSHNWSFRTLFWYELIATVYFGIELAFRLWSCSHNIKYSGLIGKFKFIINSFVLVELLVMIASFITLFFINEQNTYSNIHSILRLIQILRFLYADRNALTWKMLLKVTLKHKSELLTTFYIATFILLLSSYLILLFEKPYSDENDDNAFHSFSDAVYWAIITMTTIGFGKTLEIKF